MHCTVARTRASACASLKTTGESRMKPRCPGLRFRNEWSRRSVPPEPPPSSESWTPKVDREVAIEQDCFVDGLLGGRNALRRAARERDERGQSEGESQHPATQATGVSHARGVLRMPTGPRCSFLLNSDAHAPDLDSRHKRRVIRQGSARASQTEAAATGHERRASHADSRGV